MIARVAALSVWLWASSAWACPLCLGAKQETRDAFLLTTGLLSLLPLAFIGGLVWWVRKRILAAERAHSAFPERS